MPLITDFEHNGISVEKIAPLSPIGLPGVNIGGLVGTAPNKHASVQFGVPVRIAGQGDHFLIDSDGSEQGSIIHTLLETHAAADVPVWVVVVDEGVDEAATTSNVIGSVSGSIRTGVEALSECFETPNIIAAPFYSHQISVVNALGAMGNRLGCRVVIDVPGNDAAASQAFSVSLGAEGLGHDRCAPVDCSVDIYSRAAAGNISVPGSVVAFGQLCAIKPWVSWQNRGVAAIDVARVIEYNITDKSTEADLLNKYGITAICHTTLGGFSLQGNRTVTGRYISHVGLEDVIQRKLAQTAQETMGRNLTGSFVEQVVQRLNNFLQDLSQEGALIDAEVKLHPTKNTVSNYQRGKWYVYLEYGAYSPNEFTVFELSQSTAIVERYLEDLING